MQTLTSKQRAALRAQANGLDAILHIGKGGLSDALLRQAEDALAAREIIKGRTLETAPEETRALAQAVADAVGAALVCVVGRSFVLYKKTEDKKTEDRKGQGQKKGQGRVRGRVFGRGREGARVAGQKRGGRAQKAPRKKT